MKWSEKTKADKIITVLMIVYAVGYFPLAIATLWETFENLDVLEELLGCFLFLNMGLLQRKQNPKNAFLWFALSGSKVALFVLECISLLS